MSRLYSSFTHRDITSPDAFYKVKENRSNLTMLCTCHVAMLEAAMLSSQGKHSGDLYLESFSSSASLDIFTLLQSVMNDGLQLFHQITAPGTRRSHDTPHGSHDRGSYPKAGGWTRPSAVMATSLTSPSHRMRGTTREKRSRAVIEELRGDC